MFISETVAWYIFVINTIPLLCYFEVKNNRIMINNISKNYFINITHIHKTATINYLRNEQNLITYN